MADLTYEKIQDVLKILESTEPCTFMCDEELVRFIEQQSKWPNKYDFENAIKRLGWNYQCKTS